jgi:hypothetical protein
MSARLLKVHTRPAACAREKKDTTTERASALGVGDNTAIPFVRSVLVLDRWPLPVRSGLKPDGDTGVFGVPLRRGFLFDSSIGSFWSHVRTNVRRQ